MAVVLSNKSRQLLIVRLNSGKSLHLAPSERSSPCPPLEVGDNRDVQKLAALGLLGVEAQAEAPTSKGHA